MDIVERLRQAETAKDFFEDWKVYKEAADEIERLREALRVIGYGPPHEGNPLDLLNQFVDLARATLKERK